MFLTHHYAYNITKIPPTSDSTSYSFILSRLCKTYTLYTHSRVTYIIRERGNGKSGSEKRRKKERKSEKKTERKERRNSVRESENEKRNDSVFTDEEEDSIASRMKRKRRRNRQPEDDDDENNSYEY